MTFTSPLPGAWRVGRFPRVALGAIAGLLSLGAVATAPAGASSHVTTVKAVETDFHIALSKKTFAPGRYTFVASNKGQTTHALQITGSGLKNAKTKNISPGQSAKLTVTFKKGPYDIFCPVPGHKALGMNVNIVVARTGRGDPSQHLVERWLREPVQSRWWRRPARSWARDARAREGLVTASSILTSSDAAGRRVVSHLALRRGLHVR